MGDGGCENPASASSCTPQPWKQESHGGEVTDAHEPMKGRLLSVLSILEVLSQGCLTWAEGHLAGREVSHPGVSKEGCHRSRCPGTLTGILTTTWEVSIIKSRNQCGQRIFSLIPLAAPGFLSAYGTLGFFSVWRLSRKPQLIKDISTFRHL